MQGKAEDADGLTPAKDDNAALRALYHRAFAWNSDDCYKHSGISAPVRYQTRRVARLRRSRASLRSTLRRVWRLALRRALKFFQNF